MGLNIDRRSLVKDAIHFGNPCRVPLAYRSHEEKSDVVQIEYKPPAHWKARREGEDEWGCLWRNLGTGLGQVVEHPLENWDNFARYSFPEPHDESRFLDAREKCARYAGRYLLGSLGISGFNRMFHIRGFENILCDLYQGDAKVALLADKVYEFESAIIEEYAGIHCDGVCFYDDWGTERALIISPALWRRFFKPRYKVIFDYAHEKGMDVFFHSCGYVWDILDDLIEVGVNVLNVEQPLLFNSSEADGIVRLAREFGGRVCFMTNPDGQRTLNGGTPAEVEREASHIVEALGGFGGGLIALADAGADHGFVPEENVQAMMRAFERYRFA